MKITLSKFEVETIIRNHYNLALTDCIDVVDVYVPPNIERAIKKIEAAGITNANKIPCIRTFRDCFLDADGRSTVGLADAKAIMENWQNFKAYVSHYGALPKDCYSTRVLEKTNY